jgi:hypothetical protein
MYRRPSTHGRGRSGKYRSPGPLALEERVRYVALPWGLHGNPSLPTFLLTSFPVLLSTVLATPRVPRPSPMTSWQNRWYSSDKGRLTSYGYRGYDWHRVPDEETFWGKLPASWLAMITSIRGCSPFWHFELRMWRRRGLTGCTYFGTAPFTTPRTPSNSSENFFVPTVNGSAFNYTRFCRNWSHTIYLQPEYFLLG